MKVFGESGLLENEPSAPAEQAHTTRRHFLVKAFATKKRAVPTAAGGAYLA